MSKNDFKKTALVMVIAFSVVTLTKHFKMNGFDNPIEYLQSFLGGTPSTATAPTSSDESLNDYCESVIQRHKHAD